MTISRALGNNVDRTLLVPSHEGPHVLPNSPFWGKLVRHARRNRTAIRDVDLGVSKTYGQLLSDALSLRLVVSRSLPRSTLDAIARGEEVYIGVLAAGGYEFTVAVLAVLALGAAFVPMSVSVPVNEAAYFVTKCQQRLILVSSEVTSLGLAIQKHLANEQDISVLEILPNIPKETEYTPTDISISSNPPVDESKPGLVIFTSGTTGRPKGAVMRHSYVHEAATAIGEGYDLDHNDVVLHVLPVHHTTGLATSFFTYLNVGGCIEFKRGSFDPAWVWDRWLQGGLTVFSAVPTILLRLKWHFEQKIQSSPNEAAYFEAANRFRAFMCGSSALQQQVQEFWTKLRKGRPILTRYGATEYPGCLKVPAELGAAVPKGCVGLPVPGVELKLSDGDEGELLVKSPNMFAKYIFDPVASAEAHDEAGYFKTGDICRRENGYYYILGRASVDIIKSGGYKISAIEIERACLDLPYVSEAAVVGVEDEEFGQRVGAIISLTTGTSPLSIQNFRSDLRQELAPYKLPTLLRIVDGELPKGGTGKVQKKIMGPKLFPKDWVGVTEVQCYLPDRRPRASDQLAAKL
ncbi:hypothetical protein LTR10_023435 [Elasticomyces elasticus]|uniref:AMP-dependent synthetase/ligase domain-containing protein n=1 Tax=Exophiala sideris TaxID=1016849 RepID=A0ABR0J5Q6_9EURO|nr:hypothetical protein LTR10_023435 [Elasticomyces elasticus]KAK5028281.1 hypothetical protein LTS07_006372 [Exophiala sideris]KAK5036076.1 hypothetical protein LTR13_005646 [Exophiala sideris]KAK5057113.1 hypothetical protein LTR69_007751 [Exophiala sideris]KAK5181520.1 hypothetical protein LTR44_006315 [Eurotiomycetes sp. CCFEE 6388]